MLEDLRIRLALELMIKMEETFVIHANLKSFLAEKKSKTNQFKVKNKGRRWFEEIENQINEKKFL